VDFILLGVLAVVGVVAWLASDWIVRRSARSGPALRRPLVRRSIDVTATAVVVLFVYVLAHGDFGGTFYANPTYPSLQTSPDLTLVGTVAYNPLAIGSKQGKFGCVNVIAASGAKKQQLFCASQPKAMGADLTWLSDGRLQAVNQGSDNWRKVIDVSTGVTQTLARTTTPTSLPDPGLVIGPQGQHVEFSRSMNVITLTLVKASQRRDLVRVNVPRDYRFSELAWSPDGKWFALGDGGRIMIVTTSTHSTIRFLADGYGAAVTGANLLAAGG
jgi:hypothetical protein